MLFFAGALAGLAVGLGAGAFLHRRTGRSSLMGSRGFATAIAILALLVVAIALGNRDRRDQPGPATSQASPTTTSTTTKAAASTTTASPEPTGLISVPNVSHPPLARRDAVTILKRAGLAVSIETLPLANVPPGFVISQDPLPAAMAVTGSTVTLVVSAAA
jgi:hypothetical protein